MPEQRLSLEEAAKLLGGLHPNTVRARAAKGKIPYEKDNSGKWYVFLDPEKVANDRAGRDKMKPPKRKLEPTNGFQLEDTIVGNIKVLEATIGTLNEELKATRAERDALKAEASERAEIAARLEIAMAALSAKSEAAAAEMDRLRLQLGQETDENRKLLTAMLERLTLPPTHEPEPVPSRRRFWQRLFKAA
jgi:hypothetical protein